MHIHVYIEEKNQFQDILYLVCVSINQVIFLFLFLI